MIVNLQPTLLTDVTSFKLRLRFNLGSGAETVGLGRSLHSGHWHRASVSLGPQVTLGLDTLSKSIKWVPHWFDILKCTLYCSLDREDEDFTLGNFTINSFVYLGGLPAWYSGKLSRYCTICNASLSQ